MGHLQQIQTGEKSQLCAPVPICAAHSGNTPGSILNTAVPRIKNIAVMMRTPMRLIKTPTLAISAILIRPLPKTMALGGVATGIIKAQDAESVAGIISNSGLAFMAKATDANMGRIISVVAVLDVSSVKKVKPVQMMEVIRIGDIPASPEN